MYNVTRETFGEETELVKYPTPGDQTIYRRREGQVVEVLSRGIRPGFDQVFEEHANGIEKFVGENCSVWSSVNSPTLKVLKLTDISTPDFILGYTDTAFTFPALRELHLQVKHGDPCELAEFLTCLSCDAVQRVTIDIEVSGHATIDMRRALQAWLRRPHAELRELYLNMDRGFLPKNGVLRTNAKNLKVFRFTPQPPLQD